MLVITPGYGNCNGVLLEEADAVVPVEQLRVILINDFSDGRIEIATSIADEAHVAPQHVVAIGAGAVPP